MVKVEVEQRPSSIHSAAFSDEHLAFGCFELISKCVKFVLSLRLLCDCRWKID